MNTKILIIMQHGTVVNVLANGGAEVFLKNIHDTNSPSRIETTQLPADTFDSQIAIHGPTRPPQRARWDIPSN